LPAGHFTNAAGGSHGAWWPAALLQYAFSTMASDWLLVAACGFCSRRAVAQVLVDVLKRGHAQSVLHACTIKLSSYLGHGN